MDVPRRFLFRGFASGIAAHIRRPTDEILPVQAASALPITGGVSESKAGPQRLSDYLSFESASTSAVGDYANARKALAMTHGELAPGDIPTQTTVIARVEGAQVQSRLKVALVVAQVNGKSPESGEPPSLNCNGSSIEGVELDGYGLTITLATTFFSRNSTKALLAATYAAGLKPKHQGLIRLAGKRPRAGKLPESNGLVYTTIVEKMAWTDKQHPDATIDGNVLIVPDFGRIFFGELFVNEYSRRLTMVRLDLGSPTGGDGTMAEAETNGSYWPVG